MKIPFTCTAGFLDRAIILLFEFLFIISRKLSKSSNTQMALPKVPITRADSFS